jgi:hypothetical protein
MPLDLAESIIAKHDTTATGGKVSTIQVSNVTFIHFESCVMCSVQRPHVKVIYQLQAVALPRGAKAPGTHDTILIRVNVGKLDICNRADVGSLEAGFVPSREPTLAG